MARYESFLRTENTKRKGRSFGMTFSEYWQSKRRNRFGNDEDSDFSYDSQETTSDPIIKIFKFGKDSFEIKITSDREYLFVDFKYLGPNAIKGHELIAANVSRTIFQKYEISTTRKEFMPRLVSFNERELIIGLFGDNQVQLKITHEQELENSPGIGVGREHTFKMEKVPSYETYYKTNRILVETTVAQVKELENAKTLEKLAAYNSIKEKSIVRKVTWGGDQFEIVLHRNQKDYEVYIKYIGSFKVKGSPALDEQTKILKETFLLDEIRPSLEHFDPIVVSVTETEMEVDLFQDRKKIVRIKHSVEIENIEGYVGRRHDFEIGDLKTTKVGHLDSIYVLDSTPKSELVNNKFKEEEHTNAPVKEYLPIELKDGDAQSLISQLLYADNSVLIDIPTDYRTKWIKKLAQSQSENSEIIILKLLQTTPPEKYNKLFEDLKKNNSELLRLLQGAMKDKAKEYAETLRALVLYSTNPETLMKLLVENSYKTDMYGDKRFPWSAPTGATQYFSGGIQYHTVINSEGKIEGNYYTYEVVDIGDRTFPKPIKTGLPKNEGTIKPLDPFDLITLVIEYPERELDAKAGQEVVMPAIMLLYLEEAAFWNAIKDNIKLAALVGIGGLGAYVTITATSIWGVMEGVFLMATSVIEGAREEIEKTEAGKVFLKYYDLFNTLTLVYAGGKLLVALPEIIAGMAKAWQMYRLAAQGNETLVQLAKMDTGMAEIHGKLDEYVNSLDDVKKTKALQKIATEQARVELSFVGKGMLLSLDPAGAGAVAILAKYIQTQIKLGYLSAKATVQEVKAFLKQQAVYKELAKLSEQELDDLILKVQKRITIEEAIGKIKSLNRVRTTPPNYSVGESLTDDEVVVFVRPVNDPKNFSIRKGVDDQPIQNITQRGKSASIGVSLDIEEELPSIFGRKLDDKKDVIFATTAKQIREAGFDVVYAPTGNKWHVRIIEKEGSFDNSESISKLMNIFIDIKPR